MQTVISGNAADVLQNVPSITTDIDGNVSLRGNSNFTVLIDGRPSVVGAQDAFQQIPASSIEKIFYAPCLFVESNLSENLLRKSIQLMFFYEL